MRDPKGGKSGRKKLFPKFPPDLGRACAPAGRYRPWERTHHTIRDVAPNEVRVVFCHTPIWGDVERTRGPSNAPAEISGRVKRQRFRCCAETVLCSFESICGHFQTVRGSFGSIRGCSESFPASFGSISSYSKSLPGSFK